MCAVSVQHDSNFCLPVWNLRELLEIYAAPRVLVPGGRISPSCNRNPLRPNQVS